MRRRDPIGRVFRCIPTWASYSPHQSAVKDGLFLFACKCRGVAGLFLGELAL